MRQSLKIAIADDYRLMRETLKQFFSIQGCEVVVEANNGKNLIEQIESSGRLPDLCIVDIDMPVMDGYETTKALQSKFPNIKVLATTVFNNQQKFEKVMACGALGVILKNSEPDEWQEMISTVTCISA
ncbi:response regulator [Gynurincola endophyticus]|jgi:DNA-binding NarL/FixJ family response regulator|uniref:response regulator n=1 Tax=Gynurincola endophyticus TaxID=2479004 RepID=UPI000F8CFF86|nr:response regulator transcription factor [Gynurincola endophyticus]